MDTLIKKSEKFNIKIIEDACQTYDAGKCADEILNIPNIFRND